MAVDKAVWVLVGRLVQSSDLHRCEGRGGRGEKGEERREEGRGGRTGKEEGEGGGGRRRRIEEKGVEEGEEKRGRGGEGRWRGGLLNTCYRVYLYMKSYHTFSRQSNACLEAMPFLWEGERG